MSKNAVIIVDVQNDFCPGGALPVPKGDEVVPIIRNILFLNQFLPPKEKTVVFLTQDWHPEDHCSFSVFPKHCVKNTTGAELHPGLKKIYEYQPSLAIRKGMRRATEAFSGFAETPLDQALKHHKVGKVFVCGLAIEYCVKATALDAKKLGFKTYVILDACRGLSPEGVSVALEEMKNNDIELIEL